MRVGIAVYNWKLHIFRKRLTEAGFKYEEGGQLTNNTALLAVETDDLYNLKTVIEKYQIECRNSKLN